MGGSALEGQSFVFVEFHCAQIRSVIESRQPSCLVTAAAKILVIISSNNNEMSTSLLKHNKRRGWGRGTNEKQQQQQQQPVNKYPIQQRSFTLRLIRKTPAANRKSKKKKKSLLGAEHIGTADLKQLVITGRFQGLDRFSAVI